ncbi:hypothetical protein LTR66_016373, partial [Elasticomyces elasticus]
MDYKTHKPFAKKFEDHYISAAAYKRSHEIVTTDLEQKALSLARGTDTMKLYPGEVQTTHKDYSIGEIVYTPWAYPNLDADVKNLSDLGFAENIGHVSGKRRPGIVVAIYED